MTSTPTMLRRIDEEITWCRQQIAQLQVQIANAETTRRFVMGMEEADQAAAEARKGNGGLLAGSTAKPVLIVRKAGSADPPPAPLGIVASGKRKGQPRLRKGREGEKQKRNKPGNISEMRARILAVVTPGEEPIASSMIGNLLGLPLGEEHRKSMHNALYNMRANGLLKRDDQKRYYRPNGPEEVGTP